MAFEKFIERFNPDKITREEEVAFAQLANKLIFLNDFELKLSRKNIPKIAAEIKKEYLNIELEFKKNSDKEMSLINDMISNLDVVIATTSQDDEDGDRVEVVDEKENDNLEVDKIKPVETMEDFLESILPKEPINIESIKKFIEVTLDYKRYGDIVEYSPTGFTPALSMIRRGGITPKNVFETLIDRNCFGFTICIGAFFEKMNLNFEFGHSADHPYVVLYLNDETYLTSNFGVEKFEGKEEVVDGFKVLRSDKLIGKHEHILVTNFDEGLVFEIFENFELLRQMLLGNDYLTLPNTEKSMKEISSKYEEVLQKADWQKIQTKLFPEISKYFSDNKDLWDKEKDRIVAQRYMVEMQNIVFDIFYKAQKLTRYGELDFKEGLKLLKSEMVPYVEDMKKYLFEGREMDEQVSENVKIFFDYVKKFLDDLHSKDETSYVIIKKIIITKLNNLQE